MGTKLCQLYHNMGGLRADLTLHAQSLNARVASGFRTRNANYDTFWRDYLFTVAIWKDRGLKLHHATSINVRHSTPLLPLQLRWRRTEQN